jgi:hypothetical protein
VEITKQMLGIETRKKLLYLDQSFFSAASKERRHDWVDDAIARITELLDLQLLAIPYSSSHIAETDLYKQRDASKDCHGLTILNLTTALKKPKF